MLFTFFIISKHYFLNLISLHKTGYKTKLSCIVRIYTHFLKLNNPSADNRPFIWPPEIGGG